MNPFPSLSDGSAPIPAPVRGALWMLFSAASFAVVSGAIRYLAGSIHPFELAFFRTFFLLVFMLPWLLRRGLSVLHTRRWGAQTVRCTSSVAAMMLWFTALAMMPIADVTALTFTSPLFSVIGAALILREQVGIRRWMAVVVGFAGTLIILRPGAAALEAGSLIALASAVFMSVSQLSVKSLARTDSPVTIVLVMALLTTPLSLIPALFVWTWPPLEAWPVLVLTGLGATGVQMGLAKAMSAADITAILPFDFSRLVFAALVGFAAFGELLDFWTGVGALVIFAATFYVARREARLARQQVAAVTPPQPGP